MISKGVGIIESREETEYVGMGELNSADMSSKRRQRDVCWMSLVTTSFQPNNLSFDIHYFYVFIVWFFIYS